MNKKYTILLTGLSLFGLVSIVFIFFNVSSAQAQLPSTQPPGPIITGTVNPLPNTRPAGPTNASTPNPLPNTRPAGNLPTATGIRETITPVTPIPTIPSHCNPADPNCGPLGTFTPTPVVSQWWHPSVNTSWQIQYSGTMDYSLPVQMYDLDGFDTSAATVASLHARGVKVACYFSAGTSEDWRPDYAYFSAADKGNGVQGGPNGGPWPGENWLNTNSINVRNIMLGRIQMCKSKGFDAIDPDNVDGYTNNTGFPLTAATQLDYNTFLATYAHSAGLAAFLKNDTDQVVQLVPYFDGAIVEQCFQYGECASYSAFVSQNKPVFEIEYSTYNPTNNVCSQANTLYNFNTLYKKLSLNAYRVACR